MSLLSVFDKYGIEVSVAGPNEIELSGLSKLEPDKYEWVLSFAKERKSEIIRELKSQMRSKLSPGECKLCPAAGFWDYSHYAGRQLCFAYAYFFGKTGRPQPCEIARQNCPLKERA